MRFLSVAERELRAAARRNGTYYVRWITGVAFFGLLVWLLWAFDALTNQRAVTQVLQVFSVLIFLYCLVIGTARTADCLSSEKREGTLGLLYLTNLNSAEIVAGKLCSHALATVYGLVAIFPILALPLLLGGITAEHFWRIVLALLTTILFSLAAGFTASAVCVRQFPAVSLATGAALVLGTGLLGVAGIVNAYRGAKWVVELLAICCPLYPLLIADGNRLFGAHYWLSLAVVSGLSLTSLVLVSGLLSRTWRDRPKVARHWNIFKRRQREPQPGRRTADPGFRRRLLNINPFFWLAGRNRVSSPVFMLLVVVIVVITTYVTAPFFSRVMRAGNFAPMIGSLFAWLWAGLVIHGLSLYYAAMVASQRLAEDKQAGALEMILCTPTTERSISRGLWLAFGRRMLFPAVAGLLVHCFFIWQVMIMASLEPPGRMPRGMPPGELFWAALFNEPVRGHLLDWVFVFMFQILLLLLGLLVLVWITLGWVGRWLGLRMKHPGFAPLLALTLVFVPPILGFSFICYLADEAQVDRMPDRQYMPLMMWVAFGIGVLHCLLLSLWAAGKLRREFRGTVTSRFQPPAARRWWRPNWRGVGRLALRATAVMVGLALLVPAFYGYQNWRSRRAWQAFQTELKQKGESLDVAALLPGPVPDDANLARHPAFQKLIFSYSPGAGIMLSGAGELQHAYARYPQKAITFEWTKQEFSPLDEYAAWLGAAAPANRQTNSGNAAPVILRLLEPQREFLQKLAEAARRPHFQIATNRDALAVIRIPQTEMLKLEHLHFLFVLRAGALLDSGQSAAAAEDLLTSLHLAQLARQSPDVRASLRVQVLLVRSFQPLWEGLVNHEWSEPQLAAIQEHLAQFNLLADHTNAIRRVTLAHIAVWRGLAETPGAPRSVPNAAGGYTSQAGWRWQPRAWWFHKCLQFYQVGQRSVGRVDVAADRVGLDYDWNALNGLSLGDEVEQLFEPYYWGGPNPTVIAFAQTALNQARIACALERHWRARGQYPESLELLVPAYLDRIPHDVVRGRPMIYEQTGNGRYVLRGVGPNEQDDRKTPSSDDWLWAYPTNLPPAVTAPGK